MERLIYAKLIIVPTPKKFTVFWSHTWNYNIQANERLTKVKEKWSTIKFDVFIRSFVFFIPVTQTVSAINKWCMLFFTCIRLVAHVLARELAIACIKLRRLSDCLCYMVIFCIQNILIQYKTVSNFSIILLRG